MNNFWFSALLLGTLTCITLFSACEDDDMITPGDDPEPCCETAPINYEDLSAGTDFPNGSTYTTQGQKFEVLDFTWSSGGIATNGAVQIRNSNCLNPAGLEAQLNNVNTKPDLPANGVDCISFKAVNKGGNLNLTINNDFINFNEPSDIDGTTLGGVTIMASGAKDVPGVWRFEGNITEFLVGGQELFVDDWCIGS